MTTFRNHDPEPPSTPPRTETAPPTVTGDPTRDAVRLWILRALVRAGGLRRMQGTSLDEDIADALDVPRTLEIAGRRVHAMLQRRLRALERAPASRSGVLFQNADMLGEALALTATERELLAFAVALETNNGVQSAVRTLTRGSNQSLMWSLARVLQLPLDEVRRATRSTSALWETRLLRLGPNDHWRGGPLKLMDGLSDVLLRSQESPDSLLRMFFQRAPQSALGAADFSHVEEKFDVVRGLLAGALEGRVAGVNVLIHGAPGTGKTELSRVVTAAVGAPLFEVCLENDDGDAMRGGRLGAYALAQRLLGARGRGVILFDEMEDAFPAPSPFDHGTPTDKAWTNRLLESNPVPTIWLSNAIGHIAPSFLRRFDLIVEIRTPPRAVRRRIVADQVAGLGVREAWIDRASTDARISPAIAARATRTARMIGPAAHRSVERTLDVVLAGTLDTSEVGDRSGARTPTHYDLSLVNASVDVEAIIAGLARRPQATVCLYGAPGTGKTAFARHVADRIGKPLVLKRASDLLAMFVGQTEQAIAQMFRDARSDDAVLLLDEADSFLRDRAGARHSWEVTQVNELLVQMEAFEGVFICATNLFDSLDPASLRRFDLKVRFDALTEAQRWKMFEATCVQAGEGAPAAGAADAEQVRGELARLVGLTAGDFATVVRRARVLGKQADAGAILAVLAEECRMKSGRGARPVGFRS